MDDSWQTRIIFWAAICASCAWLAVAITIDEVGISQFSAGGFGPAGRGYLEILIVFGLTLLPLAILLLIVRAIWHRGSGPRSRIIARAFYPLIPVLLFVFYVQAIEYLFVESVARRWNTGSITYVCSTNSRTVDYNPKTIGAIELRLTEDRHPGNLGTWIVTWPGKKPIKAASFHARTGSIGGSQGITWRESDGRHMTAYLSFSDIVSEYGPAGIWLSLVQGDASAKTIRLDAKASTKFTCGPDPASHRP